MKLKLTYIIGSFTCSLVNLSLIVKGFPIVGLGFGVAAMIFGIKALLIRQPK